MKSASVVRIPDIIYSFGFCVFLYLLVIKLHSNKVLVAGAVSKLLWVFKRVGRRSGLSSLLYNVYLL